MNSRRRIVKSTPPSALTSSPVGVTKVLPSRLISMTTGRAAMRVEPFGDGLREGGRIGHNATPATALLAL